MQRHELPLSILMVDIDHFKHVNDTHGHQVGDLVLIAFAECLRQSSPDPDWVVRFGGEEFLIALLEVDRAEAYAIAERLREHIAEMRVDIGDGEQVAITASIGVATSAPGQDLEDVIAHADRALYRAKRDGRNLVRAES